MTEQSTPTPVQILKAIGAAFFAKSIDGLLCERTTARMMAAQANTVSEALAQYANGDASLSDVMHLTNEFGRKCEGDTQRAILDIPSRLVNEARNDLRAQANTSRTNVEEYFSRRFHTAQESVTTPSYLVFTIENQGIDTKTVPLTELDQSLAELETITQIHILAALNLQRDFDDQWPHAAGTIKDFDQLKDSPVIAKKLTAHSTTVVVGEPDHAAARKMQKGRSTRQLAGDQLDTKHAAGPIRGVIHGRPEPEEP